MLYAEIADRRADPNLAERTDALAMLVRAADEDGRQMTDRELRDQLMTLLLAGHDTTATALSWAFERLVRHPAILAKAVAAAEAGDEEYLDAIARETLRIRPVIFDVGRVLKEPVEIAGYRLDAGVTVIPAIGLVHASPALYDQPEQFRPERMIGATLSPPPGCRSAVATVVAWAPIWPWPRCGLCWAKYSVVSIWTPQPPRGAAAGQRSHSPAEPGCARSGALTPELRARSPARNLSSAHIPAPPE